MRSNVGRLLLSAAATTLAVSTPRLAVADDAVTKVGEIVVTGQKREQPADDIGMPITAATGETLKTRGIEAVTDLPRLVPGLTIQDSAFGSTSFALRGVGPWMATRSRALRSSWTMTRG